MRLLKILLKILLLLSVAVNILDAESELDLPEYTLPVLQNWLYQNQEVVESCVYKKEWVAPTKKRPKGMMLSYATVTRVYKGNIEVGEKIMLTSLIEYEGDEWKKEAISNPDRVFIGDGNLVISMFNISDCEKKDGYWSIGNGICRFSFTSHFYKAFQLEKKRDEQLKGIPN